jgi:hypothetical protein
LDATEGLSGPPRGDNQDRGTPELPGSSLPARSATPVAYIYQPARSPMQGGLARLHEWVLEFAPWNAAEIEPLMGWTSSRDPFASIPRLRFPDRESAIAFAERHGWRYLARDPPARRVRPKSYADNFKYNLGSLVTDARPGWEGPVGIDGVRAPPMGIGKRDSGA